VRSHRNGGNVAIQVIGGVISHLHLFCFFCFFFFDRCANTKIGDRVTEILSALLNLLTDLEHHEEKLRARHHQASAVEQVNIVIFNFRLLFFIIVYVMFVVSLYVCSSNSLYNIWLVSTCEIRSGAKQHQKFPCLSMILT
jgi:hypothetical protein